MNFRTFSTLLLIFSQTAIATALFWWQHFYRSIMGANLFEVKACIYSDSGWCAFTAGAANFFGETAYDPKLFWFGVGGLLLSFIMKISIKNTHANTSPEE